MGPPNGDCPAPFAPLPPALLHLLHGPFRNGATIPMVALPGKRHKEQAKGVGGLPRLLHLEEIVPFLIQNKVRETPLADKYVISGHARADLLDKIHERFCRGRCVLPDYH